MPSLVFYMNSATASHHFLQHSLTRAMLQWGCNPTLVPMGQRSPPTVLTQGLTPPHACQADGLAWRESCNGYGKTGWWTLLYTGTCIKRIGREPGLYNKAMVLSK